MNKQKYIKAPYNFVPLSEKVFYPDWADKVSHDVPFSDGESGVIEVTLKAETPVFIGNTDFSNGEDKESSTEFCHYIDKNGQKQYYIPGTSVKGMIRSVLEIMSFGKIKVDERLKYATRDWDNENVYELKNVKEQEKIRCGYLVQNNDTYYIEDHGKPYRIGHKDIDDILGKPILEKYFSKNRYSELNKVVKDGNIEYDPKTARFKYYKINKESDLSQLRGNTFSVDESLCDKFHDNRVKINPDGEIFGDIILTGQPDQWVRSEQRKKGKYWEFVFKNKVDNKYYIDKNQMKDFEFIYEDSDDWKYWKEKERIPVFFRVENEKIKDFGLAFMYKVPFRYKPVDLISSDHKNISKCDLAETIFGSIKNKALKGRVQCSNFKLTTEPRFEPETTTILGSPKASYYPLYIKQNGPLQKKGKDYIYSNYNDSDASLSGWKRYPVKKHFIPESEPGNMTVTLKPIKEGAVFKGKIRYHNLRPVELGALLSALTFHNSDGYFHSIGMAKPYGCGAVSLSMEISSLIHNIKSYLAIFEQQMDGFLKMDWHKSREILELFAMSKISIGINDAKHPYMALDMDKDNQFTKAKKEGEYLHLYTETKSINDRMMVNSELEKQKNAQQAINLKIKQLLAQFDELFQRSELDKASKLISHIKELSPDNELVLDAEIRLSEEINLQEQIETLSKEYSQLIESGRDEEAILILEKLKEIDAANIQNYNQNIQKIRHKINTEKARSGGLSELREKLNGKDFEFLSKRYITKYIKATGKIPSTDIDKLYEILMDCYAVEKNNFHKWHGVSAQDPVYWKRIKGWLKNEDDVNILFNRFQKEQNL